MWEVVARLQELEGSEERRIATLAEESDLHPRQIRLALDYASERPDRVEARVARDRVAAAASEQSARRRTALLG